MKKLVILGAFILFLTLPVTLVHADTPTSIDETAADVVPYQYGKVVSRAMAVYENPGDEKPARWYTSAGTWVSIRDQRAVDDETWYLVDRGGWMPASAIELAELSEFRGVRVTPGMSMPFGFVIADTLNIRARPGVAVDNPPVGELHRYTVVPILEESDTHTGPWYKIGKNRWVSAKYVRRVAPVVRPEEIGPDEKWIEVNLREQTLIAYEGSQMVYATLVSSGLPRWPTVTGLFRIWIKITNGKMSGGSLDKGDYYYLADVPWTMYFKRDYGLHGAYWHDDFGRPRSHGCVNLSPLDANWLFEWTMPNPEPDQRALLASSDNLGTWVFVHAGTQPEAPQPDNTQWARLMPATDRRR
jgi:hypothetical protein